MIKYTVKIEAVIESQNKFEFRTVSLKDVWKIGFKSAADHISDDMAFDVRFMYIYL